MTSWSKVIVGEFGGLRDANVITRGWIPETRQIWWGEIGGRLILQRVNDVNAPLNTAQKAWQHRPELSVVPLWAEIRAVQFTQSCFLSNGLNAASSSQEHLGYLIVVTGKEDINEDDSRLLLPSTGTISKPPLVKTDKSILKACGQRSPTDASRPKSYPHSTIIIGIKSLEQQVVLECLDYLVLPVPDTRAVLDYLSPVQNTVCFGSDYHWATGRVFFGFGKKDVYELAYTAPHTSAGKKQPFFKGSLAWVPCYTNSYRTANNLMDSMTDSIAGRYKENATCLSVDQSQNVIFLTHGVRHEIINQLSFHQLDIRVSNRHSMRGPINAQNMGGSNGGLNYAQGNTFSYGRFIPNVGKMVTLPTTTHELAIDGNGEARFEHRGGLHSMFKNMLGLPEKVPFDVFNFGSPFFLKKPPSKSTHTRGDPQSIVSPPSYLVTTPGVVYLMSLTNNESEIIPTADVTLLMQGSAPPSPMSMSPFISDAPTIASLKPNHPAVENNPATEAFQRYHRIRGSYATMTIGWIHLIRLCSEPVPANSQPAQAMYTWLIKALMNSGSPANNHEMWANDGAQSSAEKQELELVEMGEQIMGLSWIAKLKRDSGSLTQTLTDLTRVCLTGIIQNKLVVRTAKDEIAVVEEEQTPVPLSRENSRPFVEVNNKRGRDSAPLVGYSSRSTLLSVSTKMPVDATPPSTDVVVAGLTLHPCVELFQWCIVTLGQITAALEFVRSQMTNERQRMAQEMHHVSWTNQSLMASAEELRRLGTNLEVLKFTLSHLSAIFFSPPSLIERNNRTRVIAPALFNDLWNLDIDSASLAFKNSTAVLSVLMGIPRSPTDPTYRSLQDAKNIERGIAKHLELQMKEVELFSAVRAICSLYLTQANAVDSPTRRSAFSLVSSNTVSMNSALLSSLKHEASMLISKVKAIEDWGTMHRLVPDKAIEIIFALGLMDEGLMICKLKAMLLLEEWGKSVNANLLEEGIYSKDGWGQTFRNSLVSLSPSHSHARLFFPQRSGTELADEEIWQQFCNPADICYIVAVRQCMLPVMRYIKHLKNTYYCNGVVRHEGNNLITRLKLALFPKSQGYVGYYPTAEFFLAQAVLDWNQIFGEQRFPFDCTRPLKGDVHPYYLLFQLRDAGEEGGELLAGPQAASYLFSSALTPWLSATKLATREQLQAADISADRLTFSLREQAHEGHELAHRLVSLEQQWGMITESLVLYRLSCRSRGNKAIPLVQRIQLMNSALRGSEETTKTNAQEPMLLSKNGIIGSQPCTEQQKIEIYRSNLSLCRDLVGSFPFTDLATIVHKFPESNGSVRGLSSALECLATSQNSSESLKRDSLLYQDIMAVQRSFLLTAMEGLILLLRRHGIMNKTAINALFHPLSEVFSSTSNSSLNDMLRATNCSINNMEISMKSGFTLEEYDTSVQGALQGLSMLRLFIIDSMSKVYSTSIELHSEFLKLIEYSFSPKNSSSPSLQFSSPISSSNMKKSSIPPMPIFNILGKHWISLALSDRTNPYSQIENHASKPIMTFLAYNERDREVAAACADSRPNILIGSELGPQQQIAWGIFAAARQTLEARSILATSDVGPLVDAVGCIVKCIWVIMKNQKIVSQNIHGLSTASSSSHTAMVKDLPFQRWSQTLLQNTPLMGKNSLLALVLSYLHAEMSLGKWEATMTPQKRLMFPMACVLDRLESITQEAEYREFSQEISDECCYEIVAGMRTIYEAALADCELVERKVLRSGIAQMKQRDLRAISMEVEGRLGERKLSK